MLIEAVVVVAAPASDQVAWLDEYDVPPDVPDQKAKLPAP